jgi:hypothetical protein
MSRGRLAFLHGVVIRCKCGKSYTFLVVASNATKAVARAAQLTLICHTGYNWAMEQEDERM